MLQAAALYASVGVTGAGQSVAQLRGVSNQVNTTQKQLNVLGLHSQGVGKGIRQVAGGLIKIGETAALALAAATAASAHFASNFQAQTELIHTQAGASQAEVEKMRAAIQDMVHQVGTSPDELAKGLYHIESVGVRGAAALDVLKASALGAKMGLADMESVSNALAAVSKSGSNIGGVKDMVTAMGTLNAIVGVGNMRMQDLVDAFGTGILGTSKTFGVGLRELGSALAVLTDAGVPANVAATRLSMTFSHMAAPTAAALKTFKKLGVGQFEFAKDLRSPDGIFVAFQDLHDHLAKMGEIKNGVLTPQGTADVTKIFGGSRFGATAMQLLEQMDRIKLKYDQIGASQQTFGEKVQATMATASFQWGQFKADLENAAISFGTAVLPSLVRGLGRLDAFIVAHRADAARLGTEVGGAIDKIGAAIDKIDWHRFAAGFDTVKTVAKLALEVLGKVPPEVGVAFAGLVGIDKLSGGLLGKGAGNIIGAGLNQLFARGSFGNPMWVRDVAGGLGKIGSGGSLLEAAGGVAGIGTIVAAAAPFIALIAAAELADPNHLHGYQGHMTTPGGETGMPVNNSPKGQNGGLAGFLGGGTNQGTEIYGPPKPNTYGLGPELAFNGVSTAAKGAAIGLAAIGNTTQSLRRTLMDEEAKILGAWGTPGHISQRAYMAGHSNRSAVVVANDFTARWLSGNSKMDPAKIPSILTAMKGLQQRLLAKHDTTGARMVGHDIAALKANIAAHLNGLKTGVLSAAQKTWAAQRATTEAVKDKDLSVTVAPSPVTFNVDGRRYEQVLIKRGWSRTGARKA